MEKTAGNFLGFIIVIASEHKRSRPVMGGSKCSLVVYLLFFSLYTDKRGDKSGI